MIYLMATSMLFVDDMHSEIILKIGYSDDSRGFSRFDDYKNSGMTLKVLHTIPGGSYFLEGIIQDYFRYTYPELVVAGRSKEWFKYSDLIIDKFSSFNTDREIFRYLIDNFMLIDGELSPKFFLLPDKDEQSNLLAQSILSDFEGTDLVKFFKRFFDIRPATFPARMKFVCEVIDNDWLSAEQLSIFLSILPTDYEKYLSVFNSDRLRAFSYRKCLIQKEYDKVIVKQKSQNKLERIIFQTFEVGKRYKKSDIKQLIGSIYAQFGIKTTPKANILEDYFEIKSILINDPTTKKRDSGFEIIKRRESEVD